jgi:nucleolar complex protein 2
MQELTKLAEKDPEFFKYLQDNDQELLNFDTNADVEDEDMDDPEGVPGSSRAPALTSDILRQWQKALLQVRIFI